MAFVRVGPEMTATRVVRMTVVNALAILFLSSADLSFEWRAGSEPSTHTTRGVGLSVGYFGVWEVASEPAGLRAALHVPDFGFAGAVLVARGPDSRAESKLSARRLPQSAAKQPIVSL